MIEEVANTDVEYIEMKQRRKKGQDDEHLCEPSNWHTRAIFG